jgi:hypothetical protein
MVLTSFHLRIFLLSLVFALTILFSFTPLTFAQTGAGIGITPATIEDAAEPGEKKEYTIGVTNLSSVTQTYFVFTRDIIGVQSGGVPIYAEEGAEKTGYELTQWVTLDVEEITVEPGQEFPVGVVIDVPEFATPGSHFGGVFISMTPPKLRSTGAAVGYQVANIISIRVAGDAVVNAQIRQFSTGNYIYGESKVDFNARIENKGTVLVRPIGPLEIYNMFGKRVALLTFNESKAAVFPGVTRDDFNIVWEDEGPGFGRYQAILSLVYGDQGRQSTISSTVSFWMLPMNIILPAVGVLAFLLLAAYVTVKIYIRNKLNIVTGGSRRIVRNRRRGGGMSALLLVTVVMLAVSALFLIILLALFA